MSVVASAEPLQVLSHAAAYYLLSGEGTGLPRAELESLIETYDAGTKVEWLHPRLAVAASGPWDTILARGAYIRQAGKILALGSKLEALRGLAQIRLDALVPRAARRFHVRAHTLTNSNGRRSLEQELGELVRRRLPEARVSFENPDWILHAIEYAESMLVGMARVRPPSRWAPRRPRARPFFHPSALYPKLARALVNLAAVREGGWLLDPFCGTGSVLIEACLVGMNAIGLDADPVMTRGAYRNLQHYDCRNADALRADAFHAPVGGVDGIVTDLPYGRCASRRGEPAAQVLHEALSSFATLLPPGKRAVFMRPHAWRLELPARLRFVYELPLYVHRNLTRLVTVVTRA